MLKVIMLILLFLCGCSKPCKRPIIDRSRFASYERLSERDRYIVWCLVNMKRQEEF
jgi:hypothetical protein